jgi:hypothetical protein
MVCVRWHCESFGNMWWLARAKQWWQGWLRMQPSCFLTILTSSSNSIVPTGVVSAYENEPVLKCGLTLLLGRWSVDKKQRLWQLNWRAASECCAVNRQQVVVQMPQSDLLLQKKFRQLLLLQLGHFTACSSVCCSSLITYCSSSSLQTELSLVL